MAEFLFELFSEEIPARMQARAAEDLARLLGEALAPLTPQNVRTFHGMRRITYVAEIAAGTPESRLSERGPRANAPEQALAGFLKKHNAARADLREEDGYFVLEKTVPAVGAQELIARELPALLRRFPWPKSMRWGGAGNFAWVRPLRRVLCLLDGKVASFALEDVPALQVGAETEGHRFHAPGPVTVANFADYQAKLRERFVVLDAAERKRVIADGIAKLAAEKKLTVVDDPGLLDEVAGLVEWPVPLLGVIDAAFMDLPPEVMQVSMRVNQRYFALRNADGSAAPYFAFAANIAAHDGGAEIAAGNARVLRARFADARHFWDLDRRQRLESRVEKLNDIVFHAKLGTQGQRVQRLEALMDILAPMVGADVALAKRAAHLAKADLVTGMVGEFPELQGVMGGYYACHDGEDARVAAAIAQQYTPKGPADAVPREPVAVALALADRLDMLAGFFAAGEKPSGSGDPQGLRRAALGVIRIIRENGLRLNLRPLFAAALAGRGQDEIAEDLFDFIAERLRVQMRADGARHDVLSAVFAAGRDDDLVRVLARSDAVADFIATPDGANLLAAYKRAANILRIENKKDGPHEGTADPALLGEAAEKALYTALAEAKPAFETAMQDEKFVAAMQALAGLRAATDEFFEKVTVNAPEPELRRNRLRLLSQLRATMDRVADFSKIEG